MNSYTSSNIADIANINISELKYVSIDIEFIRRNTYYAKCCFVQLEFNGQICIIDAIANPQLPPKLKYILEEPTILKILHAGGQDLEILFNQFGVKNISNIFDTQVAGMFAGLGHMASYKKLVKLLLNIEIDKSKQNFNWDTRPISNIEIEYLKNDVKYLYALYQKLVHMIHQNTLFKEDDVKDESRYNWQILSNTSHLHPIQKWRIDKAKTLNKPLNKILTNEILHKMMQSSNLVELKEILKSHKYHEEILKISNFTKEAVSVNYDMLHFEILSSYIKHIAMQHKIPKNILISNKCLQTIIATKKLIYPINHGWRYIILGKNIFQILIGAYGVTLNTVGLSSCKIIKN